MDQIMTREGHRWDSSEYVQDWVSRTETQPLKSVKRREQFNMVVDLIPFKVEDTFRVLDLGAGWGALLDAVLETIPHATGISLDSSQEMLTLGHERLARFGDRVSFVKGDLDDSGSGNSVDGQFSVIVSSQAIHHLIGPRKKALYGEIYVRQAPGRCFINVGDVPAPDPSPGEVFQRAWLAEVVRMARAMGLEKPTEELLADGKGSRSATEDHSLLAEHLLWLEEAGFAAVDVFWKYLGTAVFGGFTRRAEPGLSPPELALQLR